MPDTVWLITGISRGLGRALTETLLARGQTVVSTTRSGTSDLHSGEGRLHSVQLDLREPEQASLAVHTAHQLSGRIDVVVNHAGYGLFGAIEEADAAETAELFDVDFFGPLRIIQAALPLLRAQGSGHVMNISSIAALAPGPGSGLYAAAKSALSAMSESLAAEFAPLGIRVTVVEPECSGPNSSPAAPCGSLSSASTPMPRPSGAARATLSEVAGRQPGDPRKAAAAIIAAVEAPIPPLHLVLGEDAIKRTRTAIEHLAGELDDWETTSLATGFVSPPAHGSKVS